MYVINKGVSKPVEFRGLKAQYIWYLGGGLLVLLILFAILYIIGVNAYVCLLVIAVLGAGVFTRVYALSNTYGEFGLMKKRARRHVPKTIVMRSRKVFMKKGK